MEQEPNGNVRIAVLIDAENTSPQFAEALLDELAKYGAATIKRAYGDFSSPYLAGWTRQLNARAIRAMHQNAFTAGKNSTDSALIIDAMDLLYADNVEAFALVSSDSDFTGLALRLREAGKTVYGLGLQRTPQSLQNACDRFIALELLAADAASDEVDDAVAQSGGPTTTAGGESSTNLQSLLTKAVNATAGEDGWVNLAYFGSHLRRMNASFDPRTFGHAKLSSLVEAQRYLETVRRDGVLSVRVK